MRRRGRALGERPSRAARRPIPIERALARARGVLPDQGPIGVFIHHNTLHAFQHLPFHEGVQAGAAALGAQPVPVAACLPGGTASRTHRRTTTCGREIATSLGDADEEVIAPGLTRAALHHTLMVRDCELDDDYGLMFAMRDGTASQCADAPLWDACLRRAAAGPGCRSAQTTACVAAIETSWSSSARPIRTSRCMAS